MEFVPIFTVPESEIEHSFLWAVQFEGEECNELERLLDEWNDPIYLRKFFTENEDDLNSDFWKPLTISQAIFRVMDEAEDIENILSSVEDQLKKGDKSLLKETFKPLHRFSQIKKPQIFKAKSDNRMPFLRLYGLELEDGQYIITGGGIKLTKTNQESAHIALQINKTERVKSFLELENIFFLPNE